MMQHFRHVGRCNSGSSAVEFAIIAPLFLMMVLSIIAYGIYISVAHSVQQLAADAARTAVAGLSSTERVQLSESYIRTSTLNHYLIDPKYLTVKLENDPTNPDQFTVSLKYDASSLPVWDLYAFAMPGKFIERFATIRIGGV